MLQAALLGGAVPSFYANGFGMGQTATEVTVVLVANQAAVGVVSLGYPIVKRLIGELQKAIEKFEAASGREVDDPIAINEKLQETKAKENASSVP
jgi:hypothetical protein